MADASVRTATAADAVLIAGLQVGIWRDAYDEVLPRAMLDADPAGYAERWQSRIEGGGPVLLAIEGPHPVGYAALDASDLGTGRGEIELLGVLPRWARRGHGGRLLAAAGTEFRRAGLSSAYWWVLAADRSIASFLTGAGWADDGARRSLDTGERVLDEARWSGSTDLIAV